MKHQRNPSHLQEGIYQKMKFHIMDYAQLLEWHEVKVEQTWSCSLSSRVLKHPLGSNAKAEELFFLSIANKG